jgi:hypothetical protein
VGLDWHAREVRSARWPVNRSAQDPQRLMPASFHSTPVPRACCGITSRVRCAGAGWLSSEMLGYL